MNTGSSMPDSKLKAPQKSLLQTLIESIIDPLHTALSNSATLVPFSLQSALAITLTPFESSFGIAIW
jgi:hypothetical protein